MVSINKMRLMNFKRFRDYTIEPNEHINILVGDNEVGKSTVLEAIDIVSCGNVRRVEAIGLDRLINIDAVKDFASGTRDFDHLPKLIIELYLSGHFDFTMNGKNNSAGVECDGIRLVCEANPDYRTEITSILNDNSNYFPYDYYSIRFSTFADEGYTGYKKKLRSILIDSSHMNSEYATNDFVRRMYMQYTESEPKERAKFKSSYRQMRTEFKAASLQTLNARVPVDKQYSFGLKAGSSADLESDLMIYENEVGIDSKGTGRQVFIKTDFALEHSGQNVDVILIEEPENHLSPVNLRRLVQKVADAQNGQLFITTHNSLISTRLEVSNLLIMHTDNDENPVALKNLGTDTAKYFKKTPPASIVEFALSKKAVLVEGPAEYMMMEKYFVTLLGCTPESIGVHVIDVRGLSFKRYLDVAKLTGGKVAVVTDNDEDYEKHCVEKYAEYKDVSNVKIFYDNDNSKRTYEVVLYCGNKELCDSLFGDKAQDYMLNNKTEAAYKLLTSEKDVTVPEYIRKAIEWIKE